MKSCCIYKIKLSFCYDYCIVQIFIYLLVLKYNNLNLFIIIKFPLPYLKYTFVVAAFYKFLLALR